MYKYIYIYTYNAIIQSNSKNCKWFPMSLTLQKYCEDLSIACLKTGPLNPRQARPQNIAWFRLPWPHKPHRTSQLRHSLRKISHLITPGVSKIEIYWDHMQAKKLKFNPTKRRMLCVCVYIYTYISADTYTDILGGDIFSQRPPPQHGHLRTETKSCSMLRHWFSI